MGIAIAVCGLPRVLAKIAKMNSNKIDPLCTLLFPNNLSNEELKQSLLKMGFCVKTQDREELLQLFVKNVMPKPQRDIYKKEKVKVKSLGTEKSSPVKKRKLEESSQIEETNSDSAKKRFKAKSRISFP